MKFQPTTTHPDTFRRDLLTAGLASAALLILGVPQRANAHPVTTTPSAKMPDSMTLPEGIKAREVNRVKSRMKGVGAIVIEEVTFEPGSRGRMVMANDMICEMLAGSLAIKQGSGQSSERFTARKGHVWTCRKGEVEETLNQTKQVAVMRVINLRS